MTDLSIVVPVYRSETCLEALEAAISEVMIRERLSYELILVNDGSPDRSWAKILELAQRNPSIVGLSHRRNFGQDNAIMTGLRHAKGNAVVIMDDDLQHSPDDIPALLAELNRSGADVVFAHFVEKKQALWKNMGSWFNGKVAEWLVDKPPHIYLSPFKMVRGDLVPLICSFDGPYPYVDALLFQVTNRFSFIDTTHRERFAGDSSYTFGRSVSVWMRLAFSFSVKPLHLVTWLGVASLVLGLTGAALVMAQRLLQPESFSAEAVGWASLMVTLLVIAGVQMFSLGILGEYVGRTHININKKPQSVVAERTQPVKDSSLVGERG